jgi:hypothetical protein
MPALRPIGGVHNGTPVERKCCYSMAGGKAYPLFIKIECPTTGQRVAVTIKSVGGAFAQLPPYVATVACPSCGKRHAWRGLQTTGLVPPVAAA